MRKKTVLRLFNQEIAKNNRKYELELVERAIREHKDIAEGFGPSGEPDYKYYAFDWDDNVMNMTTEIMLIDVNGKEVGMSTDDFAEFRAKIGDPDFKYKGVGIKGFADDAFRYFRHPTGDAKFLEDIKTAPEGPSWGKFKECLNGASIFAIITARGHHPDTLKAAVRYCIYNNVGGIESKEVLKNVNRYIELAKHKEIKDNDQKIEYYLNQCKFHPVSFGAGSAANPEEGKVKALREFIAYCERKSEELGLPMADVDVEVGFSDDDEANIAAMEKYLGDVERLKLFYTGKKPRKGENEEIEEQNEPFQRKWRAKHRRMKVRLIGKGNKKAAKAGTPFTQNPDLNRSKSAPAGFGGLEETEDV